MCIAFVYAPCPPCSLCLVLAMNRDEWLFRPTMSASWHNDLLAGWDMYKARKYGTWLAIDKRGDVAFLTNLMINDPKKHKLGRGYLVKRILKQEDKTHFLAELEKHCSKYNPFTLALLKCSGQRQANNKGKFQSKESSDPNKIRASKMNINNDTEQGQYHLSFLCSGAEYLNMPELAPKGPCSLNLRASKNIFVLGNHPPSEPFLKCNAGEDLFRETLEKYGEDVEKLIEHLLEDVLSNKECFWPDPQIMKQNQQKLEGDEKQLRELMAPSSIFYSPHNGRGTRMQTVLTVDQRGKVNFVERHRDEQGQWKVSRHQFTCGQE